jgi:hypothetical protein
VIHQSIKGLIMIKRENLQTGTKYSNALGESAFVGSRIEGKQRVTTFTIDVPYEDSITGENFVVKSTTKISVPVNSLPGDYAAAHEKCAAYKAQELPNAAARAELAAGAIEWTIDDIANA